MDDGQLKQAANNYNETKKIFEKLSPRFLTEKRRLGQKMIKVFDRLSKEREKRKVYSKSRAVKQNKKRKVPELIKEIGTKPVRKPQVKSSEKKLKERLRLLENSFASGLISSNTYIKNKTKIEGLLKNTRK